MRAQLDALQAPEKAECDTDFPGFPVLPLENLARGRTTFIPCLPPGKVRAADPEVIWGQLQAWRPAMMSGSPAYLEAMADAALARGIDASWLRVLYTGGAPVTAAALEKFARVWTGARIQVVYGSTEAEPVSVMDAEGIRGECLEKTRRGLGCCVGRPVASLEVRILSLDARTIDPADLEASCLPAGEVGEVLVRGAHVNEGYWDNPEAERANKIRTVTGAATGAVVNIWHRMGDAGYLDDAGRLWLTGRAHTAMPNPGYVPGAPPPRGWPRIFPYQAELVADAFSGVRKSALLRDGENFCLAVETKLRGADRERLHRELVAALAALATLVPAKDVRFHRIPVDPRHNSKVEYDVLRKQLNLRDNT
jgi:acyl-CoA synthetase (AMP-forming)/AMP-acid ligase II